MTRRLALACALAALLGPTAAHADGGLVVALYLPDTPLSLQQLSDLGEGLARQLGGALSTPVVARAYRKEDDFTTALRDGSVDLALCEPLLVATRGLRVVGVATSGPGERTTTQLALYSARPLPQLLARGAADRQVRLAGVRSARHKQLVQRVLLEGDARTAAELQWLATPDVLSSLEVVRSGRAELAVAPLQLSATPSGLHAQAAGLPIPNPALVVLTPRAIALADRVAAALPRVRLEGPYVGLRASGARPYQILAAELAGEAAGQQRAPLLPNPRPPLPVLPRPASRPLPLPLPPAAALVGF